MAAYWSLVSTMDDQCRAWEAVVLVALQYSDVDRGFEAAIGFYWQ